MEEAVMLILVWVLNFVISGFNAWGCGRSWNETKHVGGMAHFMNWMGAIMSAAGFTWCYMVIVAFVGTAIPVEQDDGTTAPILTAIQAQAFCDLGFVAVYFPIVGSGVAITINAWSEAWKRRSFGTGAVAAWDTFAMVYNIKQGLDHLPSMGARLGDFFGSKDGGDKKGQGLVVLLVVACALAGVITTYTIVTTVAANARDRARFAAAMRS